VTPAQRLRSTLRAPSFGRSGEVIVFVNAGDPTRELSFELLRVLASRGVRVVELCVPFPRSFTDGVELRESHRRALAQGADLESTLALAIRAHRELELQLVLLADFAHTVVPIGLSGFLARAARAGVAATLVHALPTSLRREYREASEQHGLGTVMSCFTSSSEETRRAAYEQSSCFTYLVSRFGRTGAQPVALPAALAQVRTLRAETREPLALGFGIQSAQDIAAVHAAGIEAAVVGSAATRAFAVELPDRERMLRSYDDFIASLLSVAGSLPSTAQVSP
jgi:tryptophan synthase alpha chain